MLSIAWLLRNWSWLRWAAMALPVAGLLGSWRWERHERQLAEQALRVAQQQAEYATADAARWQAASAERDRALALQTAAVARLRVDAARLEAAARSAAQQNEAAVAAAEVRIRELEEEAHARPEDVRALGPVVLHRAAGLFD